MPSYVLVDTNVWVYATKLLRTPVARAFVHAIRRRGEKIILPEVYELEVLQHAVKHGTEELEAARKSTRIVSALTGLNLEINVSPDFGGFAARRFGELGDVLLRLPFSEDHARKALKRIVDRRPPSKHKQQEFKDSAAWEALIALPRQSKVAVITTDGDFSEDPKKPPLAHELQAECEIAGIEVTIYPDVAAYLSTFSQHIEVADKPALESALKAATESELQGYAKNRGFELSDRTKLDFTAFLTERENVLGVDFYLSREARALEPSDYPPELIVRAEGQCTVTGPENAVSEVLLDRILPVSLDGEELRGKAVFMRVSMGAKAGSSFGGPLRERISLDELLGREPSA